MSRLIKKKVNNRKGFTLAEVLIVVAIIAVLVAVSIPIFTSKLEKSKEATDISNMRAAKAEAASDYLEKGTTGALYYNADEGALQKNQNGITGYGKGTNTVGDKSNTTLGYDPGSDISGKVIKVTISEDGKVTLEWVEVDASSTPS